MGEDPGAAGSQVSESREPEEIREDIESTREELGDTVAALAGKADVKGQAKDKVEEVKGQAQEKVAGAKQSVMDKKEDLLGKAKQASPEGAASAAGQVSQKARENPVPMAIAGAFVAGFVVGRALKR